MCDIKPVSVKAMFAWLLGPWWPSGEDDSISGTWNVLFIIWRSRVRTPVAELGVCSTFIQSVLESQIPTEISRYVFLYCTSMWNTVNQQILAAIKFGASQNKVTWRLLNLASPRGPSSLCSVRSTYTLAVTYISENTQFAKFAKYNSKPKFVDLQY